MLFLYNFLSADEEPIGKIEKSSFSEQTLLELFVKDVNDVDCFRDNNNDFRDITGTAFYSGLTEESIVWKNRMVTLWDDEFDYMHDSLQPGGTINLAWIPFRVRKLCLDRMEFEGHFRACFLPETMEECDLGENNLQGSVDTAKLPRSLIILSLGDNMLEGEIDFHSLPPSLELLDLSDNCFTGNVYMSGGQSIQTMRLSRNRFGEVIDLSDLPKNLSILEFERNLIVRSSTKSISFPESLTRFVCDAGVVRPSHILSCENYTTSQTGGVFRVDKIHV
mmetsp:Transcript_38762/g.61402  ORF Transcript_38762/g.61402 Transcript_38762/m.61402 type:complete len:278 (-) Transcript_38762:50-883(-)